MRRALSPMLVLALTAGLAACGNAGGPPSTVADGGLILRIQTAGGFLPPGADLVAVPEFALTADGRVVRGGAQIMIYPGPALPSMNERTITPAGVQAIEAEARAAGLFEPDRHYDMDGIADAGTTFFTVIDGGERHVTSAYALEMDGGPGPGASTENAEERRKLQHFRERVGDLESWLPEGSLGEERAYRFDALRVVVREPGDRMNEDVKPDEKDWPFSSLATFGEAVGRGVRCGVVEGDDLGKVLPLVREATQITLWRNEGKTYNLHFRPQLPDEVGCELPERSG